MNLCTEDNISDTLKETGENSAEDACTNFKRTQESLLSDSLKIAAEDDAKTFVLPFDGEDLTEQVGSESQNNKLTSHLANMTDTGGKETTVTGDRRSPEINKAQVTWMSETAETSAAKSDKSAYGKDWSAFESTQEAENSDNLNLNCYTLAMTKTGAMKSNATEYQEFSIPSNGKTTDTHCVDQLTYNKNINKEEWLTYKNEHESNALLGNSETSDDNSQGPNMLHDGVTSMSGVKAGFYLDQDSERNDVQSFYDDESAYNNGSHRMDNSYVDVIAKTLVTKVMEQSLDVFLKEESYGRNIFSREKESSMNSKESSDHRVNVRGRDTVQTHGSTSLPGRQPECKGIVKKYDPLHLVCFEVDGTDLELMEETSDQNDWSEIGKEEDDMFKAPKFKLPARKVAVTSRRQLSAHRVKKSARFWEMEDCCFTDRLEMFEMQVLNNSE